jgi:hypothetical protein
MTLSKPLQGDMEEENPFITLSLMNRDCKWELNLDAIMYQLDVMWFSDDANMMVPKQEKPHPFMSWWILYICDAMLWLQNLIKLSG